MKTLKEHIIGWVQPTVRGKLTPEDCEIVADLAVGAVLRWLRLREDHWRSQVEERMYEDDFRLRCGLYTRSETGERVLLDELPEIDRRTERLIFRALRLLAEERQ